MKKIVLIGFLMLFVKSTMAQKLKSLDSERLKVGVVLSGGGAKGIAHIGVLKELEANGIQIDYIAGTSMGAIVGGLYAAGYSPDEMIEIIQTTDFEAILSDNVERKYKTIYDKRKGEKYIITLPFTNNKLNVPVSLSKGQGALNLLTELFEPVDTIQDFSKLPVPFFCIATDAATGDMAVLEKGSLPLAIRASASFPTFFQPVEMDDHLYIDGGVASNLPVREMRKRDVDVIIASDVQGKLKTKDEINSALTLLDQIISFEMYRKVDEEAALADIYVHPDIDGFSTFTFDDPMVLVNSGENVIKENETAFKKLASIQGSYAPKRDSRVKIENKKFKLDSIRIDGNKSYSNRYVEKSIGIKVGDSITYDELNDQISSMTYRKTIERLDYRIYEYEDDHYALRINLKESRNKSFIKIGIHYDPLYQTGVLLNFTTNHLLQKGDLLSGDVVVGDNLRYELNYIADSGGFLAYGFMTRYNHFDENIAIPNSEDVSSINLNYNDYTTRIFGEVLYQKEAALGVGFEYKYLYADTKTLQDENGSDLLISKSHYFSTFAYLDYDLLDDANFPKTGVKFQGWAQYFFNGEDENGVERPFTQVRADLTAAYSFFNKKVTAQVTLDAGISLQYSPDILDFYLGSYGQNYINNFIPFYGYEFASVGGSSYGRTVLDLRWEALNNVYLLTGGNVGKAEDGIYEEGRIFENPLVGYVVGAAWNSPLGPIELRYGNSPKEKTDQVYFNLGFWF